MSGAQRPLTESVFPQVKGSPSGQGRGRTADLPLFRCDRCPGQRRCRSVDSRRGASAVGVGCRRCRHRCRRTTVQSGTTRARFLRLHIIGPRRQSAAFRAWESAAGIGHIRTVGWPGQYPGHHRPEHQPRGTDSQLSPAHHGRAANRGEFHRRTVRWVVSPDPGLVYEREACDPRPCPRSYAEPIARPPAAKPDEPGNQQLG